jgi:hypothetical protein
MHSSSSGVDALELFDVHDAPFLRHRGRRLHPLARVHEDHLIVQRRGEYPVQHELALLNGRRVDTVHLTVHLVQP